MPNIPAKPYTDMATDCQSWLIKDFVLTKHKSKAFYIQSATAPARPKYQLALEGEPRIRAPFGCSDPPTKDGAVKEPSDRKGMLYSLDYPALLVELEKVDQFMIEWGVLNSVKLFGKVVVRDVVENSYKPLVRRKTPDGKSMTYSPTLNTKANISSTSKFQTRFFVCEELEDGKIVFEKKDWTAATKNCLTVPIIEISSVWQSTQGFGLTLETTDCMIFPEEERDENPFSYSSLVEKSALVESASTTITTPSKSNATNKLVGSSSSSSSSSSSGSQSLISPVLTNVQTGTTTDQEGDEPYDDEEDDPAMSYTPADGPAE